MRKLQEEDELYQKVKYVHQAASEGVITRSQADKKIMELVTGLSERQTQNPMQAMIEQVMRGQAGPQVNPGFQMAAQQAQQPAKKPEPMPEITKSSRSVIDAMADQPAYFIEPRFGPIPDKKIPNIQVMKAKIMKASIDMGDNLSASDKQILFTIQASGTPTQVEKAYKRLKKLYGIE